jgi:5-methylcytosine-specific restriction protein A
MGRLRQVAPRLGRLKPKIKGVYLDGQKDTAARLAEQPWQRWYNTARWKALRLRVFVRDRFQCQCGCGAIEGNTSRLVAHHKKPHRGNEHLFWDEQNVETVLKSCHDSIKQKEEQASLLRRGVWD